MRSIRRGRPGSYSGGAGRRGGGYPQDQYSKAQGLTQGAEACGKALERAKNHKIRAKSALFGRAESQTQTAHQVKKINQSNWTFSNFRVQLSNRPNFKGLRPRASKFGPKTNWTKIRPIFSKNRGENQAASGSKISRNSWGADSEDQALTADIGDDGNGGIGGVIGEQRDKIVKTQKFSPIDWGARVCGLFASQKL